MKSLIVLVEMVFLHFFADYFLQGILANMKQFKWWYRTYTKTYKTKDELQKMPWKNDYKAALFAHSFEWTFVVLLPMLYLAYYNSYIFGYSTMYLFLFCGNLAAHYYVDDLKANKHKINLIQDQRLHFIQILTSWIMWWAIIGWN